MKDDNSIAATFGKFVCDITNLLTILFCTLQACDIVNWKWYQIMIPIFVRYGLVIIALLLAGILSMKLADQVEDNKKK